MDYNFCAVKIVPIRFVPKDAENLTDKCRKAKHQSGIAISTSSWFHSTYKNTMIYSKEIQYEPKQNWRIYCKMQKEHNMTQMQFAEKLGVTNKAVSKWETGKCLPDAALFDDICMLLNITLNEFFVESGLLLKTF